MRKVIGIGETILDVIFEGNRPSAAVTMQNTSSTKIIPNSALMYYFRKYMKTIS